MNEIKIKCPTCGKVLRLQDAPNINAASFTCPVCEEKHVVGKCQRYVEQPKPMVSSGDETRYGGASARQGGDETRIGSQPQCGGSDETRIGSASSPAVGVLMDNMGRTYQLRLGINTIGRKAASSPGFRADSNRRPHHEPQSCRDRCEPCWREDYPHLEKWSKQESVFPERLTHRTARPTHPEQRRPHQDGQHRNDIQNIKAYEIQD